MFFKQRPSANASLSYFFGCGGKGAAVAVDVVAGDEPWFVAEAQAANVNITHVIDTHLHADRYSGGKALAVQIGAKYCLHEAAPVRFPFHALRDQEVIEVGNVAVTVLHTPGHTLDSICLAVADRRRGEAPWFLITGDTLFVGGVGRPDLAGREHEMAAALYDSLQSKILSLANEVEIYPGHQAGSVCGAGLSGKPSSTVGFERRFNPALQFNTRAEFVRHLTESMPPRPAEMDKIVAVNSAGA